MTSGMAPAWCDLQQGLGSVGGAQHGSLARGTGGAAWTGPPQPRYFPPQGLSPSRRTPYKATFCRMSNREGMGSLLAKLRVDPR